jgi:glycosyltransferase involved in cell wall biosynthesis
MLMVSRANDDGALTVAPPSPEQLDIQPDGSGKAQKSDLTRSGQSVILVINSLQRGGAQKQLMEAALRLSQRGWQISVVSLLPLAPQARMLEAGGVPVYSLNVRNKLLNPAALFRMWALVREIRPQVMITFLFHASVLGAVVGRAAGVQRIVASVRSQRLGGRSRERLFRWSGWLWDKVVVNSTRVARELVARKVISPDRCHVIPNGIEIPTAGGISSALVRAELGIPDGRFVWLAVGSLLPAKDYPSLLRAFHALSRPDALLLVAGDGPLMPSLHDLQRELQMADTVRFLGEHDAVHRLVRACDAFVCASAWEGMPNAVMEALAAARPVVATAVGGVPEVIEDGATGWLVEPGDPGALAIAMDAVMTMEGEVRARIGQQGRERLAELYGWERVIPLWERVLTGLAAPSTRAGVESMNEGAK